MSNLLLLLKIQFQSLILRSTNRRHKKKAVAGIGMLLLMAGLFTYMSVIYVSTMVFTFPEGYQHIALYIMGLMSMFMLLIFGYQSAGGHLFGFKDYDLLMALPVKKSEVLLSKFLSFLMLEYFYGFFLLAPSIIIVGYVCHYGIIYYVLGLIAWFILPIVPMVIASLLSYFSMYMAGKFKYKNLMNNIFYIVLMALVFVLIFYYQQLMLMDATQLEGILSSISTYLPFMSLLFDGMVSNDYVHYLLGVVINLGVLGLFVRIFAKQFMKLNGEIKSGYKVKNFKLEKSKAKSSFMALLNKEIRTYFSNTVYFMNTAVMPILLILGCIYLVLSAPAELKEIVQLYPELILPILFGVIMFVSLTSCTTNSSISLEGKNFDHLKSFPIDTMNIFLAKIALNILIIVPSLLICLGILAIGFNLRMVDLLLSVLTIVISAFFISELGLILNLHYYRLDWESPAIIVKQSMPVLITTLGGMVVVGGIFFVGYLLQGIFSTSVLILICNLGFFLLDVGMMIYLNIGGRKQFYRIH